MFIDKISIKLWLIFLSIVFNYFLISCNKKNSTIFWGNRIVYKIDIIKFGSEHPSELVDSFDIYCHNELVICVLPVYKDTSNIVLDSSGQVISEVTSKEYVEFLFYAFKPNDKYGVVFKEKIPEKVKVFSVDSFRKAKLFSTLTPVALSDSLINSSEQLNSKYTFIEKYYSKIKRDTYPDSTILFYGNRAEESCFSFSTELEIQKNRRLKKIVFIYNPTINQTNNVQKNRQEIVLEVKRLESNSQFTAIFKAIEKILNP